MGMFAAVTVVVNINEALAHAGPDVLEFLIAYVAMRVLLTDHGAALSFINLLCSVIAIVALIALLDTATSQYFTHDLLAKFTGYVKHRQHDYRLGLLRATSTLEHPIHLGLICSFGLLLAVGVPIRARSFKILACAFGLVASISSAPIQSALIGIFLLAYDRMLAKFQFRWHALIGAAMLGAAAIFIANHNPIGFINEHFTFEPSSGWYREWEWITATAALNQSPWFGIAYAWPSIAEQTGAVSSIDSLWLATALTYGYPCCFLLLLSFISVAFYRTRGPEINLTASESKLGTALTITMVLVIFLGFTVDLWASGWVFISILAGVKAHLAALGARPYTKSRYS